MEELLLLLLFCILVTAAITSIIIWGIFKILELCKPGFKKMKKSQAVKDVKWFFDGKII